MSKLPSLPLWVDEWTASTRHLNYEQRGILLSLLILMWERPHCRIPNDNEWMARYLGISEAKVGKVVRPIIVDLCKSSGNWITHERLRKDYEYVRQKVEMNRASAKRRWKKEKDASDRTATADADAMLPTPTPTLTLTLTHIKETQREVLPQSVPSPIGNDWRPSQADREFAASLGWNAERVDFVAKKFRTYYQARPLSCTDVSTAWRMWVLREKKDERDNTPRVRV
ncbi:DUF1376 domain-containing protein [Bradyrhizobium brasilense]|uniref:DUF1376 domain-containing protein n=1 Tax=Bradyrhizobium brasilense TaxID=1419277 RepID=UPI0024B203DD|nr:DUF1376 domain-containing protein [Bradyrhizobium australafricanum]WFU34073.1 DUF1376 domain-containing protein [Bradyrhizobium australafricanum]